MTNQQDGDQARRDRPVNEGSGSDDAAVEGDAATYLEALVPVDADADETVQGPEGSEGSDAPAVAQALPLEIVGHHLRLSGTVMTGGHRRLSDFVNTLQGLISLRDVRVLRRNGEATRVTAPSMWVNPNEVTMIGELRAADNAPADGRDVLARRAFELIVVTPGHTLTGKVHLNPEALLSVFIELPDPAWIPMTDVRARLLADRRVTLNYAFALINRRHIVAATELRPETTQEQGAL